MDCKLRDHFAKSILAALHVVVDFVLNGLCYDAFAVVLDRSTCNCRLGFFPFSPAILIPLGNEAHAFGFPCHLINIGMSAARHIAILVGFVGNSLVAGGEINHTDLSTGDIPGRQTQLFRMFQTGAKQKINKSSQPRTVHRILYRH